MKLILTRKPASTIKENNHKIQETWDWVYPTNRHTTISIVTFIRFLYEKLVQVQYFTQNAHIWKQNKTSKVFSFPDNR